MYDNLYKVFSFSQYLARKFESRITYYSLYHYQHHYQKSRIPISSIVLSPERWCLPKLQHKQLNLCDTILHPTNTPSAPPLLRLSQCLVAPPLAQLREISSLVHGAPRRIGFTSTPRLFNTRKFDFAKTISLNTDVGLTSVYPQWAPKELGPKERGNRAHSNVV